MDAWPNPDRTLAAVLARANDWAGCCGSCNCCWDGVPGLREPARRSSPGGELIDLYLRVGEYISRKLESAAWGEGVAKMYTKAIKGDKDAPVEQSYAGKTIVFELKDGVYTVTAQGGGVSDKDLADFAKRANKPNTEHELYSDKPVKVGESWKISDKGLAVIMEDAPKEVDLKQVVATGKLLMAYHKNGQQWGVIEVVLTGPATKLGPFPLSRPIDFELTATLETAIDGSAVEREMKVRNSFKGRGEFTRNDVVFSLDIDLVSEYRWLQSAEK